MQMANVFTVLCCICGKSVEKFARVILHCYNSGTYFRVVLSNNILRARISIFLPIFLESLSRYDAYCILKQPQLKFSEETSAIAVTYETYEIICGIIQGTM